MIAYCTIFDVLFDGVVGFTWAHRAPIHRAPVRSKVQVEKLAAYIRVKGGLGSGLGLGKGVQLQLGLGLGNCSCLTRMRIRVRVRRILSVRSSFSHDVTSLDIFLYADC